jgi:hypothetical protein
MPIIAEGPEQVNRLRIMMIHQGLRAEEMGMRLTAKAPTCLSICKKEFGFKGSRESIRRQLEAKMREMGGYEEYLSKRGFPIGG